jgi:hypothetical protein
MLELPNLEGQPGWVIIVVVGLVVFGGLGVAYLRREARKDDEDDPPQDSPQVEGAPATVSLPAGANALDLVKDSMGVLATQAAAHKADADRAEEEARDLARQLAECGRGLAVLETRHAALQERYDELRQRLDACLERNRHE